VRVNPQRIGRYEILDTLGRGAMAVVYLAHDPVIGRKVALKTLRVDLDTDLAGEFKERFLREARAAGRLKHPGIVTIHDVGEDAESGMVFIAMELIEGRDLKSILGSGTAFKPAEAARIVADVARALDYAHRMGVVHRDIKPANIMLTADGAAMITDFGVARLESSNLTVEGQFIGTPNYMSPEQITGKPVDGRSDVFSTGVVLFELLTGERPFPGQSIAEVSLKIVDSPCPIPSTVRPGIPAGFNPVVLKCLEKDPEKRFQTAGELADVLLALSRTAHPARREDPAQTRLAAPPVRAAAADGEAFATHVAGGEQPAPPAEAPGPAAAGGRLRAAAAAALGALANARGRLAALHLPPVLHQEVNPAWVLRILAGWALLWAAVVTVLALRVPGAPPPAPPPAQTATLRALGLELRAAAAALEADQPERALALARAVVDQAPASPAARRIVRTAEARLRARRAASEAHRRAEALVREGRKLYRSGRYRSAAARFKRALAVEPDNELAASFLDLARARGRRRSTGRRPTARAPSAGAAPRRTGGKAAVRPGFARLTVSFNSPINAGTILVTMDGATLLQEPFDFTRRVFLGFKKKGTGLVRRTVLAPSGRHTLGVQLSDAERGPLGFASFTKTLEPGSEWTLRIDLPAGDAKASFFLVQAHRAGS